MDKTFERPILIYSNYCIHCKHYIDTLMKHPVLFENFIRIKIDVDPKTKKRPDVFFYIQNKLSALSNTNVKIKRVPTVITPNAEYVLSDKDAFIWLDNMINKTVKKDAEGFNSNEMTSISDPYSLFDKDRMVSTDINETSSQSYQFLDDNKHLPDDNYLNSNIKFKEGQFIKGFLDNLEEQPQKIRDYSSKQMEREQMDSMMGNRTRSEMMGPEKSRHTNVQEFNQQLSQRRSYIPGQNRPPPNQDIDWTNLDTGLSRKLMNKTQNPNFRQNQSIKEKELNNKLDEMMKAREDFNPIKRKS